MPQAHMYTDHELGFVHSKVGKPGKEISRMSLTLLCVPLTVAEGVGPQRHEYYLTDRQCLDLANRLQAHLLELAAWGDRRGVTA